MVGWEPMGGANLLVVDDEPTMRELLSASLRFAGFEVAAAATGAEALAAVATALPDLIVLDIMLPDMDGLEVVRRLRQRVRPGQVPVLFLTARDTTQDKVDGLSAGGDDYVTKPFSVEELIARIRAVLRRAGNPAGRPLLSVGDLELDPEGYRVTLAGQPVTLSRTEFRLLHCLMENEGRVLSRNQILDHVWQFDFGGDSSIVESYISYLRRKVDTGEPKLIQTVRGVGYVLRRPRR
ncbi:MAG TPA: response regulator transcription factor [Mycobacteriales bacterium]|nr:response regulator transcription factor [Mycobacteriales bacterium]